MPRLDKTSRPRKHGPAAMQHGPGRTRGYPSAWIGFDPAVIGGVSVLVQNNEGADDPPDPAGSEVDFRFGRGFVRDVWHALALSSEVGRATLRRLETAFGPIALARGADGQIFALSDICPHRGAQLSKGRLFSEASGVTRVECPYHGWHFDPQGRCVEIPAANPSETALRTGIAARHFTAVERHGLVFVWIPRLWPRPSVPAVADPPDFPADLLPPLCAGRPKLAFDLVFPGHFDHVCAGLLDPAHTPHVHQQWFWRRPDQRQLKSKAFRPSPFGFTMIAHPASANTAIYRWVGKPETEIVFRLPGLRYEHVRAKRAEFVTASFLLPMGPKSTRFRQLLWWRGRAPDLLTPFFRFAGARFLAQDRAIISMQAANFVHETPFLSVGDADMPVRWYAALKKEWILARAGQRDFVNPVTEQTLSWTT